MIWPTAEQVAVAKKGEYSYGDPADTALRENEPRGKIAGPREAFNVANEDAGSFRETTLPLDQNQQDWLYAQKLAADKSPVAALGFDPNRIWMTRDEAKKGGLSVDGFYSPKTDQIWTDRRDKSVAVHESLHRGLRKIRDEIGKEEYAKVLDGFKEETVVRGMMLRHFGDIEGTGGPMDKKQRDDARASFTLSPVYDKILTKLEEKALEITKRNKPMGPR